MIRVFNRDKVIDTFAEELAYLQVSADYWYYILHDNDMSDHELNYVTELRNNAYRLNILDEVYDRALQIYDFSQSGKEGFNPDIDTIERVHHQLEDCNRTRLIF